MNNYDQYLSYTGFSKYVECPQSYYLEYVMRKRPPMEDQRNTLNGNAMHTLLEDYINRGEDDVQWLNDNIDRVWNATVEKADGAITWRHDDDARDLLIKVRGWTSKLAGLLENSGIKVSECEAELKADTVVDVNGIKLKMGARLDIVRKNSYNDYMILDLKASENKEVMKFDQLVWYAIAFGAYMGDNTQPKAGGYILPGFDTIKMYQIPQEAKDNLLKRIEEVLKRISAGVWTPNPSDKTCFWCPVKHMCPVKGQLIPHGSGLIHLG